MFPEIINKSIGWTKTCIKNYIKDLCTPVVIIELSVQLSNFATNKIIDLCAPSTIASPVKVLNDYIIHPNIAELLKITFNIHKKYIMLEDKNKEAKIIIRKKRKNQKKMAKLKKVTPSFKKSRTKGTQYEHEITIEEKLPFLKHATH